MARLDRRTFLGRASQAAGVAMLTGLSSARVVAADAPVAETASGKIRGRSIDGVNAFRGVPYGAPTGGRNRFMPPQKPEPWAGVRDALDWAGHTPQFPSSLKQRPELAGLPGPRDTVPESEDCLSLHTSTNILRKQGNYDFME